LRRLPAQKVIDLIGVKIYANQKLWQAIPFSPQPCKKVCEIPANHPTEAIKERCANIFQIIKPNSHPWQRKM